MKSARRSYGTAAPIQWPKGAANERARTESKRYALQVWDLVAREGEAATIATNAARLPLEYKYPSLARCVPKHRPSTSLSCMPGGAIMMILRILSFLRRGLPLSSHDLDAQWLVVAELRSQKLEEIT